MPVSVNDVLSVEQIAALERKASMLPTEVLERMREKYPDSTLAEQYMLRQMNREATNAISAQLRPVWIASLKLYVPTLTAKDESVRKNAESAVANISDEIEDSKEIVKVLSAVRSQLLARSTNPQNIVDSVAIACKIFNIKPETLLK